MLLRLHAQVTYCTDAGLHVNLCLWSLFPFPRGIQKWWKETDVSSEQCLYFSINHMFHRKFKYCLTIIGLNSCYCCNQLKKLGSFYPPNSCTRIHLEHRVDESVTHLLLQLVALPAPWTLRKAASSARPTTHVITPTVRIARGTFAQTQAIFCWISSSSSPRVASTTWRWVFSEREWL